MERILSEQPELAESLDGFVWYPNSVSISNLTHSSVPSIMSGYDYDVISLNNDSTHTIGEKITFASETFVNKVKDEGYNLISAKMHHSQIDINKFDAFLPSWDNDWNEKLKMGEVKEIWFDRLWENAILFASPLVFKPKIYNNTDWLIEDNNARLEDTTVLQINSSMQKYFFMKLLPHISFTAEGKGSFIYIHSMVPHNPFNIVNENNKFEKGVDPYTNNQWTISILNDWFQWLKENDVYDNTKIVLVSDHGPSWVFYDGEVDVDRGIIEDPESLNKIGEFDFWRQNVLLLVKDFNERGQVKQDWRLMSNSDVPAIVFDENNPTKRNLSSRTLITSFARWTNSILTDKKFIVFKQFKVKDNVFDLNNWERTK